jgi:hypothetical protein
VTAGAPVDFGRKRGVFAGMVCDLSAAGAKIQLGRLPIPNDSRCHDNFLTFVNATWSGKALGFAGVAFDNHRRAWSKTRKLQACRIGQWGSEAAPSVYAAS